jgi:EAL domain-containing protein (putative c-di-GMP-specific phosphodiesterase class I)
VIREACRQLSEWRAAGLPNVPLAVNVSALQVQQGDFASFVIGQMHHHGIPAGTLQLELTESALLSNETQVIDNLQALHPAGVRLALDDFGTGYSSLSYLKRLPFDTLKIDRDFVRDLPDDPDDAAIARMIVLIAHQLRMTVTAEGVETEAQRSFLQGLGCERLQGFLLGRPASAEDAARLMAAPPVAPPRPARRDVANRD